MDQTRIQQALEGASFPARRDDLVEHARENGADDDVIEQLQGLPGLTFASPTEVTMQLGNA